MCGSVSFVLAVPAPGRVGQLQHPCGLGLGAGRDRGGGQWPCLRRGTMEPRSLRWAQPFLGTDTGAKRGGGGGCGESISFLFRSADHCESCPLSPAPHPQPCPDPLALPKKPHWPGGRAACPLGDMPCVPEWVTPHAPPRDVPHVPECPVEREVPHVPRRDLPGARARPSGHRGCSRALRSSWLGTRSAGGTGDGPAVGVPRGWGSRPGGQGGWCFPPTQSTGCQGGDDVAAQPWHPTAPHKPSQKRCRGAGGARCRVPSCDTPGCHTRPPSPPAAPGSAGGPWAALGTLTPPGHPAQSHPINRVQGSLLGIATPGGLGRAPGAN